MSIGTKIYTWICGKYVGQDDFGNKYYSNTIEHDNINAKRWVLYNGEIEASNIPPHWHAWLHKTIIEPPLKYKHKYKWQKDHQPNLTGTKDAYYPSNHPLSKKYKPDEKYEDYSSWNP